MEEPIKEQPRGFVFNSLKIRTMQDDLEKRVPQADLPLPDTPAPSPKLQALPPVPSAQPSVQKETVIKAAEQDGAQKINQFQKIAPSVLPEPPSYLPSESVSPPPQAVQPMPSPIAPPPKQTASIKPPSPSVLKPQPNLIYKEESNPEQPERQSRRMKLTLIFGVPAAVLILTIFGFIYYRFWGAPKTLCAEGQITEECRCGEQSQEVKNTGFCCDSLWADFDCGLTRVPQPLIPSINELLVINAGGSTLEEVVSNIKKAEANISGEGARIIALKLADSPSRYATLNDLINIFGIVLPENLKTNNQAFNLLVYVKAAENSSSYLARSAPETRLVLVLSQKNNSSLEQIMSDWETTMLEDTKPMILGEITASATPEFVSTAYHNGFFRYKNLPIKTTTINYTIYQNLVILGTSKNSIFYVYDSLGSNNASFAD